MRATFVMSICIILIVVLLGIWSVNRIHSTGEKLIEIVDEMKGAVESGNHAECVEMMSELMGIWNEVKWEWELLIDHHEIHDVEFAIARLKALAIIGGEDFYVEASGLICNIEHIMHKELPLLENVF